MIKLGIAFIVLLLLYMMFKEWRIYVNRDKKFVKLKEKITTADDRLDELDVEHVVMDYNEEIKEREDSLTDRINKLNTNDIEETKKDDD